MSTLPATRKPGAAERGGLGLGSLLEARARASSYGELATTLATVVAVAASLALAIGQASLPADRLEAFVLRNDLAPAVRKEIVRNVVLSIGASLLALGVVLAIRRRRGIGEVSRAVACVSPLAIAFTLPSLLAHRVWFDRPLHHLTYLTATVLVLEQLLRRAGAAWPERLGADRLGAALPAFVTRSAPPVLVGLFALGYAAYASYYTVMEHWRFQTGGFDLGIYDNLIANVLVGRPFRSPVCTPDMSYLSNHAEFGIFYLAPIYALFPRSETLLVTQGLFLGLAAVPLYLFAATRIPRPAAALVAIAYLFYAPMHGANFYDFHWMPMAMPFWLTLFYGLATRKKWLIVTATCLVLPLREETGVLLFVLGTFLVVSRYWPRVGLVFCGVGLTYFGVMKFVIMPMAGKWWFENMYAELIAPGEKGYGSIIKTLLVNPVYVWKTLTVEAKLVYALHLFGPLVLLPLRRPLLVLLATPGFFFTLLTTGYDPSLSIRFQYTTHWIPWLFASTTLYLGLLGDRPNGALLRRAALGALALGIFCHSYVYGAVLQQEKFVGGFEKVGFALREDEKERYQAFRSLVDQIPARASVAASEDVVAHVANRPDAYTLKITHGDADYLLIHGRSLHGGDRANAQKAFSTYQYGLVDAGSDFYLFKRDHLSPGTADALTKLRLRAD